MSGNRKLTDRRRAGIGRLARVRNAALAGTLALSLVWSAPVFAAPQAGPVEQDDAPIPLNLGEMASGTLANGESVSYIFEAPDDTIYVITPGNPEEAEKFDLILTSEDGEEIYNDIFEVVQFDLDDGDYTLELVAVDNGDYSLFVTAQIGDLSSNSNRPGDLIAGSFVTAEEVSGDQYATIEVPETDYWQQVFVAISGAEGDDFGATVSDESFSTYEYVTSVVDEGPLRFFTRGGEYDLTITPAQDGALTVVVLSSGPAPALALGETHEDTISLPSGESYFLIQPSEAGRQVTVTLTSENEDVDLDLSVSATPGADTHTSTQIGSNESVTVLPVNTGPLFVRVYSYNPSTIEEPVPFTILAEEGDVAATVEPGTTLWGTLDAGGSAFHMLDVPEGNVFVTILLYGNTDEDIDLRASVTDASGASVTTLSSTSLGAAEIIADHLETPTTWQIEVDGGYTDVPASYLLIARVDPVATLNGQWAIDAVASSEFGSDGYSALQATGEPNVPLPSDNVLAWATAGADDGEETLDLTFAQAVVPSGIAIYESYMPGAIIGISALDLNSNQWVPLWEGEEPTDEAERVFSPELTPPNFATDQIRIVLDTSLVPGWNEIDAVQLFGMPAAQ